MLGRDLGWCLASCFSCSFMGSTTCFIRKGFSGAVLIQNATRASPCDGGDGPDGPGPHRRPRPLGRRRDDPGQLRRQPRALGRPGASSVRHRSASWRGRSPASSMAAWWSTAASSRSSPPWPPARSMSASPSFSGRRPAARSTRISPGRSPTTSTSWRPPTAGSTTARPPGSSRSPGFRYRCC